MSDVPLTEKRFKELFTELLDVRLIPIENRLTSLETRMTSVENRLTSLETQMTKLENVNKALYGFQKREADAIEYELGEVLHTHLSNTYQTRHVVSYELKKLYDPYTNKLITDLDAAFIVRPYLHKQNYKRLVQAGIPWSSVPKPYEPNTSSSIFVMAEAKHYMDREKIAGKLTQFDKIVELFGLARTVTDDDILYDRFHRDFVLTVTRNPKMFGVTECCLYLGAAYWERGVLKALQHDLEKYRSLLREFKKSPIHKVYNELCKIEKTWYEKDEQPNKPVNDTTQPIVLQESGLSRLYLMAPSGDRCRIISHAIPRGVAEIPVGGSRKTIKQSRARI